LYFIFFFPSLIHIFNLFPFLFFEFKITAFTDDEEIIILEEPLTIKLSPTEYRLLQGNMKLMRKWGIQLELGAMDEIPAWSHQGAITVYVTGIFNVFIGKYQTDQKAIELLIRQCLLEMQDDGKDNFSRYPLEILEILKSKSCRSAIMFGERLERSECTRLIHRLSQCDFPFQCGMYPIFPMVPIFMIISFFRLNSIRFCTR